MRSGAAGFWTRQARSRARLEARFCWPVRASEFDRDIPSRRFLQPETPSYQHHKIMSDSTDHKITSDSTQTSLNQSVYVVSTEESRHVGRHRLVVVITIVTDVSKLCIEVRNVADSKKH